MREHGGNIDAARRRFGGGPEEWIDLSTGINRQPYPVPSLDPACWTDLPTQSALDTLHDAAREAYGASGPIVSTAGAQAAIELIPRLSLPGRARVLAPTYNEHAAALHAAGWHVDDVSNPQALAGADLAVVVNPNNPDGRRHAPGDLLALAERVGRLVVDESFADPEPELSLAPHSGHPRLIVLRSFGKFYGLAGVRLGFALASEQDAATLSELAGPWPVSGPAIAIGTAALRDKEWAARTTLRLSQDAQRLDALSARAGWTLVGGTRLFRLYDTADARVAHEQLAASRIWSRIFAGRNRWVRLGLPGSEVEWEGLAAALVGPRPPPL